MTKSCPRCGKEMPDEAHFCVECGHDFFKNSKSDSSSDNIFTNGKIFLIVIALVLIVGAAVILSFGMGGGDDGGNEVVDDVDHVVLTITEVDGNDGFSGNKNYYNIWTHVLFTSVPDDLNGYLVKTTYYDENDTSISQETEKLSNVYYDTDYEITVGFDTVYKKPDLDHVKVEIIKDGKVIDTFDHTIDKTKIKFLM